MKLHFYGRMSNSELLNVGVYLLNVGVYLLNVWNCLLNVWCLFIKRMGLFIKRVGLFIKRLERVGAVVIKYTVETARALSLQIFKKI